MVKKLIFALAFFALIFSLSSVSAGWNGSLVNGLYWYHNLSSPYAYYSPQSNISVLIPNEGTVNYQTFRFINGSAINTSVNKNVYLNASQNDRVFSMKAENVTVNLWFNKRSVTSTDDSVIGTRRAGNSGYQIEHATNVWAVNGGCSFGSTTYLVGLDRWYMLTLIKNSTGMRLYLNSTMWAQCNFAGTESFNGSLQDNLTIGGINAGTAAYEWDGYIDELGFWNRTLTNAEIALLYANNDTYADESIYNPTLIYPTNNGAVGNRTINFNVSYQSQIGLINTTIFLYNESGLYASQSKNISGLENKTIFTLVDIPIGYYNWSVIQGQTDGTYRYSSNYSLFVGVSIDYESHNSTSVSSTLESSTIGTTNSNTATDLTAVLYYNGTAYTGDKTAISVINSSFVSSFTAPSVSSSTSYNFYWLINVTDGGITKSYRSSTYSQTVSLLSPISIAPVTCPATTSPALYFNYSDEVNLSRTNATIDYNFKYGVTNTTAQVISGSIVSNQGFYLCINNTVSTYFLGYGEIDYALSGYTSRRYYLYEGTRLTNQTVNTTLYLLSSTAATNFLFTARDTGLSPFSNSYIALMRWYPNLNNYQVVEIGRTDDNGKTSMFVQTETADYRIGVYDNEGNLIKLNSATKFTCQTAPCSYTITVGESESFTDIYAIQSSLTYNNDTNVITFIWNDPTQVTQSMNLTVTKSSGVTSTVICSSVSVGYVGVLSCDITGQTGDIQAFVYRTASPSTPYSKLYISLGKAFTGLDKGFKLLLSFLVPAFLGLIGFFVSVGAGLFLMVVGLIFAMAINALPWYFIAGAIALSLGGYIIVRRLS